MSVALAPGVKAGTLEIVNNLSWYEGVDVIEFLSSVGRHFRVNSMLAKESVKSRSAVHF
jgi:tyrosyl-tRNA synthetase